ncbi:hypothetical protein AQUCO_05800225v1 [Aquilegia coerulea]|uniref:Uncharacterized protein n=1 Tax=Aquilegia coerulea TaxID=218851 RepID=A0A2G5CGQ6_AQUCA|nr:hypothetical protein AQUCO_05800225v1 [Aquilegia coerulea]
MYGNHHHHYNPHGGPRRPAPPLQPPHNYFNQPPPPQQQQLNPYLQNPNIIYIQPNPSFSTPPPPPRPSPSSFIPNTPQFSPQSPKETLQRIEQAVLRAHRELLATGETVSAWKVSHHTLLSLQTDSWNSLGFQIQQVPSLFRLMLVEGKVNEFIHCFAGVRKVSTLHDLNVEICKSEGVARFEELELGPLLKHPLVIHYFLIPSDTIEIVKITTEDVMVHLGEYMHIRTNKSIKPEMLLDFIAGKLSFPAKEKFGIRFQNLRMLVKAIKDIRKVEDSTVMKYLRSQQPSISLQKNALKKRYSAISRRVKSFPPIQMDCSGKHIRFVSSSSEDEDEEDVKDEGASSRQSAADGVDNIRYLSLSDDAMEQFITTWKEACRLHSVPEVFERMLQFYNSTNRRRKHLTLMFKSFPCIGLLHVAVTSIKRGMWDSLYDTFQAIGERECITSTVAPSEPESISVEPLNERDDLSVNEHSSKLDRSISVQDISEKISTFFDLNHAIPVEGKSALEKQAIFLKSLHECQVWLTKEYSLKEFGSLGYGDFYKFLEEYPLLIPNDLLESLFGHVGEKSALEVSMHQDQLVLLLSQASSCLWKNEAITKENINKLLKKQFPVTSFQVSGDGSLENFSKSLEEHKSADSSSSVLFSVTLLGSNYVRNTLVLDNNHLIENTGEKADSGLIAGALGSVSARDAVQCLLKAPMLSDLQSWSHWDLIYGPSLGTLVDWLLNEASMKELLCLVTCDGKIIRVDHSATVDEFLEALIKGSAYETAVKLLSLFSLYGGEKHFPLSLLKCHAQRGIEIILKNSMDGTIVENKTYLHNDKALKVQIEFDRETNVKQPFLNILGKDVASLDLKDKHRINRAVAVASRFILDCFFYLPSEFRSFAADVMLSGLEFFMKNAPLSILHECSQFDQRLMLHDMGLSLNIFEWIADYREFSSGTAIDLSVSAGAGSSSTLVLSPTFSLDSKFKHHASEDLSVSDDKMVISVDPDERNEVLGEVHDNNPNKVSTEEFVGNCNTVLPDQDGVYIVESIRREEFGLVSSLTEADNIVLKKQHARLGRALQCLSQELYSQDSHFLLELVQNADDNLYPKNVEPTLVFILQSTGIVVLNNEQGFTAKNIRALCDVGNSTKKGSNAGYIGHKGIGFKSVFRVTDAPEIHSNGFHVKFDISEGQIGFVLPTLVSPCDIVSLRRLLPGEANQTDSCWNTCIVLPFKSKIRDGTGLSTIVSLFSDLHPSLLLFLHRLQCIKFKNMLNDTFTVMKRENLDDGIVKVSHGKEKMSWFVETQNLQASVIRSDVQTTKIAVAFTLKESSNGEYTPHLEQQPVFAFLPLRTYGLKFILQGDFVLPSSREEVDADSAWNQWLLSEYPGLFVSAERSFCNLRCFQERPGRAVSAFMSFVPLVGEVHGFFSQLPRLIISKLRVSNCLLVEGKEEWAPPCRVLRGWSEQARILLPDNLLHQHLGLGYLHREIFLSDSLAKALGVIDYGPRILIEIISSICGKDGGIESLGFGWLSSWFSALYMMLIQSSGQASVNAWLEADLIEMSRKIPFIPLSDGTYGSIADGTIWLTCDAANCGVEGDHEAEAFPSLYANLRIVNPAFLSAASVNGNGLGELTVDNIIKMLLKIGIQRLAAHELTRVHILPALSDHRTQERGKSLMTEYVSFVMLHLQSTCTSCHTEKNFIISELQSKVFILTNHGYKRPAEVPIHFSTKFGNPIDMTKLIDVMNSDWHEVDTMYLSHSSNKSFGLLKWREFFRELGITDFVQVVEVEKNIADVSHSLLNDMISNGEFSSSGLVLKDWESPELVYLLSILASQNNQEKSKYLLEVFDKMWDESLCSKVTGCCIYKPDEVGKKFKSSFIKSINDVQWMASSIDQKLHYPRDLFYDCEEVRSILGKLAPYVSPQVKSQSFVQDLGLKTQVTIADALEILEVLRSFKEPVTASIAQMSKFYAFIWSEMSTAATEVTRGLFSGPFIFVPSANSFRHGDVTSGKLFSSEELYWHDPTGSMDLTKELLLQHGSLNETSHFINKTLADVYHSLHDFFVNECKVCEIPPPRSYIQILVQLSKVALPSQAANTVLSVLLKWASDLKSGLLDGEDVGYLKECFLRLETTVLPTEQDKWVSLHPTFGLVCWCDNKELWKQFRHSDSINFLYFGELSSNEKESLPAKLSGLMQALGIPSLSEVITREAIFYGMADCREKGLLVNWVLPYAQRYIYKLHPDKYFQLKESRFEIISNLRIALVEKLFYRHTVRGCDNVSNKRTECSCLLQENTLYIDRTSKSHPIFMELSRLFFDGTAELHFANFLHMVTTMAESGSSEEQIEFFVINSQEILKLPDEEPVWFLSSLISQQVDDGNAQSAFVSTTVDGQNLKFKRKPGISTNWPPADWKTAPDFSFARENRFRTKAAVPPPTDAPQKADTIEGITGTEDHGITVGTGVDWIIEDNSVETTTVMSQDLGARGEKPLLGSSGLVFGRASSCSEESSKAVSVTMGFESLDRSHFSERDQLSFGTPNEQQAAITGRMGELVAFQYFSKKVSGASVKWVNEETETGLPYDIVIGESDESKEYIEVKATKSARKDWFTISTREWQFAVERGESFSIAHVFLMGPNNAKVTVFKNPLRLCQQGLLRLAVLMPKSQEGMFFVT